MRKQAPHIEWQIVENDADWERLCAPLTPEPTLVASPHFPAQRLLGFTVILLLLASASAWWWRTRPSRVLQDEGTAAPVVAHQPDHFVASATDHQSDPGWWLRQRQEVQELRTAVQTAEPDTQMDIALDTVEVHGDLALASVVLYARNSRSAYRQTRFYRRTSNTWVPTVPDVTLWGPKRSLATPYFIFRFQQYDAQAVIAVAPQLDALYTTLWHNFGLPIMPTPERLVIEVNVTQQPGFALDQPFREHRLVVPSPAIYRAPVESTDADLLVQSLALPLLAHVLAQASERYQIGATWQPMMDGLRLWQMWDMDLPLALWREEIVRWLYLDQPTTDSAQTVVLPKQYEKLCTAYALWMAAPTMIGIPLL